MPNRVYADMKKLRHDTEALIDQTRYRITTHARATHAELPETAKLAVVRLGSKDKPDAKRGPKDGVYLCWARHPTFGLCRGVYAIEDTSTGPIVVVISAFKE